MLMSRRAVVLIAAGLLTASCASSESTGTGTTEQVVIDVGEDTAGAEVHSSETPAGSETTVPEASTSGDAGDVETEPNTAAAPWVPPTEMWELGDDGVVQIPNALIVVLEETGDTGRALAAQLADDYGGRMVGGSLDLGAYQLLFDRASETITERLRERLAEEPGVVAVGPYEAALGVDREPSEFASSDSAGAYWPLKQVGAPAAWEMRTDASSVRVLISDSGIFAEHEDLNFAAPVESRQIPVELSLRDETHGTHVAGIACADGDNARDPSALGAVGMAWGCELYGVDWNDSELEALFGVEGVDPFWAIHWTDQSIHEHQIQVVNMSWSVGPTSSRKCVRDARAEPSDTMEQMLLRLIGGHPDTLFIAAAGNCRSELQPLTGIDHTTVPAAYGPLFSNMITVGSVDADGGRSSFSNWGDSVEVFAPGGWGPDHALVWSTTHQCEPECLSSYGVMGGTSQAAPLVTGLAALMFAENARATPDEVEVCITASTINWTDEDVPVTVAADALSCIGGTPTPSPDSQLACPADAEPDLLNVLEDLAPPWSERATSGAIYEGIPDIYIIALCAGPQIIGFASVTWDASPPLYRVHPTLREACLDPYMLRLLEPLSGENGTAPSFEKCLEAIGDEPIPCAPQQIADDLGDGVKVVEGLCLEGWTLVGTDGPGDTWFIATWTDDEWTQFVSFPTLMCRSEAEAGGVPIPILDRIVWASCAGSGSGDETPTVAWDGVWRPAPSGREVQLGQFGDQVTWLQDALVLRGYEVDVDGYFGYGTEAAVRQFQRDRGLAVNGIATEDVWNQFGE